MLISVIIPCYNEMAVLPETHRRLAEVADRLKQAGTFEFIFVDDGSKDETAAIARSLPGVEVHVHPTNKGYGATRTPAIFTFSVANAATC